MVIEITPKAKGKKVSPLLIIGIIICLLMVISVSAGYAYLYWTINNTNKAIAEKDQKAVEATQNIKEKEAELIPMKVKIEEFAKLISAHGSPLDIFSFLERNTLPHVWFSAFGFDFERKEITISGHAEEFSLFEQQAAVFKEQPELISLNISGVSVDEKEEIDFTFNLVFNSSILTPQLDIEEEEQ